MFITSQNRFCALSEKTNSKSSPQQNFKRLKQDKVEFKGKSEEIKELEHISKATFGEIIEDKDFSSKFLYKVVFNGTDLENADFKKSLFITVDFNETNLKNTNFKGSLIESAVFNNVKNADKANFDDCIMPRPVYEWNKKTFKYYKAEDLHDCESHRNIAKNFKNLRESDFHSKNHTNPDTGATERGSFYVVLKKKTGLAKAIATIL